MTRNTNYQYHQSSSLEQGQTIIVIKTPSIPVSKDFKKAEIQDLKRYSNFTEETNSALGQDIFSLLSRNTFDRKTKQQLKRKIFIPLFSSIFWTSPVALAMIIILTLTKTTELLESNIAQSTTAGVTLILFFGSWIYLDKFKKMPESHHNEGLVAESTDLDKSRILLKWADDTIASNKRIFIKDTKSGEICEFTEILQNSRNKKMGLLGDDYHRKALSVSDTILQGEILYLEDDDAEIFQPLRDAVAESTIVADSSEMKNVSILKSDVDDKVQIPYEIENQKKTYDQVEIKTITSRRKKRPPS